MKKLFEEYGSVILTVFIVAALIVTVGFFYRGDGSGWLEVAFKEQGLTELENKTPEPEVEVKPTVYSIDFIEKNGYLYAMGATKPEYVVAAFNMEFSEVFIFTNSSSSDGLMANMDETNSPVAQNASTIKKAVIEDGVMNIGADIFWGCSGLESITISSSVENIDSNAFSTCVSLNTIYGKRGSYAETFANENGYTFVAV